MGKKQNKHTDPSAALFREFALALGEAAPDEDKLVSKAVEACIELLQAIQCSVWLYDEQQNCLRMESAKGYKQFKELDNNDNIKMVYALDNPVEELGITGSIFQNQIPIVADSYEELRQKPSYQGRYDPQLHNIEESKKSLISPSKHPCQQFYGAPITLGEDKFGVLKVENKRRPDDTGIKRFSDADQAALDTVAAMLGLALRYARASKKAQEKLISYYRFTVHAIRNEIFPIEGIKTILANFRLSNLTNDQRTRISLASNLCQLGTEGVHFYLNNLLKFLEERLDIKTIDIKSILNKEVALFEREGLRLNFSIKKDFCSEDVLVRGDEVFLSAVFKEIFRNARQAIQRRNDKEEIDELHQTRGLISISVREGSKSSKRYIYIRISDNGSATVYERDKNDLYQLFKQSKEYDSDATTRGTHGRLGLLFINEVIKKHGGYVELKVKDGFTTFEISLLAN